MANPKGPASMRNMLYNGRNCLLPPKSPFPSIVQPYVDYVPISANGQKGTLRTREGNSHHQRTSSESHLIEEQPSWLDDLLNEPETPVRRGGHRRSSSDSFAYIDAANIGSIDYVAQGESRFNNMIPLPSLQDASVNSVAPLHGFPSPSCILKSSGTSRAQQEAELVPSTDSEIEDIVESNPQDSKGSLDEKDSSHRKPCTSETDTKHAKQQFAQRSRVRKLQYIAELERRVQALQTEGSEVSAELEFLNQQHLILSMENKALKQRLESIAQEQLIKYVEHEILEKEVGRLRALYQHQKQLQQQPQHQQLSSHRRNNSKDLDLLFANLSIRQKHASSGRDHTRGQLNF